MNKTVELVNLWGAFEEKYPTATIEDFCRYQLARQQQTQAQASPQAGVMPMLPKGQLLRLIGRINKLNSVYAAAALANTGLNQLEEFGLLMHIQQAKNPRKTEVIYTNLMELSSGTDMLNRLVKRGFIRETDDPDDRRSKRLELTQEGETVVGICRKKVGQVAALMLHHLSDDDSQLCINWLKAIDQEFSSLWPAHKGSAFDDIYETVMGKKA